MDDYHACLGKDLDFRSPVDEKGEFIKSQEFVGGLNLEEANNKIIELLAEKSYCLVKVLIDIVFQIVGVIKFCFF